MKEAIVNPDLMVTVNHDAPIPTPAATQILIRIVCAGCNPKDWKFPFFSKTSSNSGDDMAGVVSSVGTSVLEFKPGDRVAAFHTMQGPGGAFAEYGLAESWTTFHIPDGISFEEAATIPLAGFAAAIGIHWRLSLPMPWSPATKRIPLIVYGASTAVGSFAIKLARRSNIHPIIAIAGAGAPFIESLIERSEGDTVVDYRNASDYVVEEIRSALKAAGTKDIFHAIDTVCENGSYRNISKVMTDGGHITLLRPGEDYSDIPASIERTVTYVGNVNGDVKTDAWLQDQDRKGLATNGRDFGLVWSRLFTSGLHDGWLNGHPYKLLPGGLNALSKGLSDLKDGKLSASKYVFKVADTK